MDIPSPCISVCKMDEASGLCVGCGRNSNEIAMWLYMSDKEKLAVLEALKHRKKPGG